MLVAAILNVDLDPFRHRVLLDKGAADGVFKGQAVLDAEGIFGQVAQVHARTAEVILISDAEHAIPVQSNRSGLRTIAVGTGDSGRLSLPFVTVESDLKVGDLLMSTGIGGVFPRGYPVAEVIRVERSPAATFAVVEARPTARLDRNREVLLVWFDAAGDGTRRTSGASRRGGGRAAAATAKAAEPATAPASGPAAGEPHGRGRNETGHLHAPPALLAQRRRRTRARDRAAAGLAEPGAPRPRVARGDLLDPHQPAHRGPRLRRGSPACCSTCCAA